MSIIVDIPVHRHRQEWWNFCGAACAQMLLFHVLGRMIEQSALFARSHPFPRAVNPDEAAGCWESAPSLLTEEINIRLGAAGSTVRYELFRSASPEALVRAMAWRLQESKLPSIQLFSSSRTQLHWVVFRAFEASRAPIGEADFGYFFRAVKVVDPARPINDQDVTAGLPPAVTHGDTDGCTDVDTPIACAAIVDSIATMKADDCHSDVKLPPHVGILPVVPDSGAPDRGKGVCDEAEVHPLPESGLLGRWPFDGPGWAGADRVETSIPVSTGVESGGYALHPTMSGDQVRGFMLAERKSGRFLAAQAEPIEGTRMRSNLVARSVGDLEITGGPAYESLVSDLGSAQRSGLRIGAPQWRASRLSLSPFDAIRVVEANGTPKYAVRIDGRVFPFAWMQ